MRTKIIPRQRQMSAGDKVISQGGQSCPRGRKSPSLVENCCPKQTPEDTKEAPKSHRPPRRQGKLLPALHVESDTQGHWLPASPVRPEEIQVQSVARELTHRLCSQPDPCSNPTSDTCRLGDLGQVTYPLRAQWPCL